MLLVAGVLAAAGVLADFSLGVEVVAEPELSLVLGVTEDEVPRESLR